MYTTPGFTDERIHVFMAVGLTRGENAREADEFIEIETMPLSRALSPWSSAAKSRTRKPRYP